MLAARMPWARTCICCREMEVVSPAGTEAEVNAVRLMTDSRGSTAPATHAPHPPPTHLYPTYTHKQTQLYHLSTYGKKISHADNNYFNASISISLNISNKVI